MNDVVSSFILIIATIIIGLVVLGYFFGYFGIQSANAIAAKEASSIASSLQIKELAVQNVGNKTSIIILPYDPQYSSRIIYIAVFTFNKSNLSPQAITPSPSSNWIPVNSSNPTISTSLTIYSPSNDILYQGPIKMYQTYMNTPQFINLNKGEKAMVWIIVNENNNYYRVGYLEVFG